LNLKARCCFILEHWLKNC